MRHFIILAGAVLLLAACEDTGYGDYSRPVYGSSVYGNVPDCAAQEADVLHQNRVGGSDYDPRRCRHLGY